MAANASTIEKRRGFIINVAYYALIFGAFYLVMAFAFWPLFPFLLAFFIAMLLQRPVNAVVKKTPLKKGIVSFLFVLLLLAVIAGILFLVGSKIVVEVKNFISYLTGTFESIPDFIDKAETWLLSAAERLPSSFENAAKSGIENLADKLLVSFSARAEEQQAAEALTQTGTGFDFSQLLSPLSGVISKASKVPSILIAIVVAFIACCFMTTDYSRITGFIKRQLSPAKREALSKTKRLTMSTLGKMGKAYCIIIAITCTEISLGLFTLQLLNIYNSGYIFLIAAIIAIVDILPILGSGTILLPWCIISFIMGDVKMGIGLLVIYIIISVLRQFIEPKLVAGQLGLPPIATLVGMYFGLKLLGVIGMFIVPVTINVLKVLNDEGVIHIWKSKDGDTPPQPLEIKKFKITRKPKEEKVKEKEKKNEQNH